MFHSESRFSFYSSNLPILVHNQPYKGYYSYKVQMYRVPRACRARGTRKKNETGGGDDAGSGRKRVDDAGRADTLRRRKHTHARVRRRRRSYVFVRTVSFR